jgi:hypothetical protein
VGDYIYCGTDTQVGCVDTASLLQTHQAIWCPPPRLRPWHVQHQPAGGECIWLCWSPQPGATLTLLGGGRLVANPRAVFRTSVLWTNRAARQQALALGYTGPLNMSFLAVAKAHMIQPQPVPGLAVPSGLSELTGQQAQNMRQRLPVP